MIIEMNKLITISQLSKLLNLVDSETNKPTNYILRYWEKEFKIIRPKKINNRRYYSFKQVEIIKLIKLLMKPNLKQVKIKKRDQLLIGEIMLLLL